MCNPWCIDFVRRSTDSLFHDKTARTVVECGSLNVNGSVRDILYHPDWKYTGIDIQGGPGVDMILSVYDLDVPFGEGLVDVVISTEMLEHVADWRLALRKMAIVLRVGGLLILTTRSPGFEYHPYPLDCWRFTLEQMQSIFVKPMELTKVEPDTDLRKGRPCGVGIVAQKVAEPSIKDWARHLDTIEVCKP